MTEARGYICDQCKKFEAATGSTLPVGWIRITPSATKFKPEPGFAERTPGDAGNGHRDSLDVCGNACGAKLLLERAKAEGENIQGLAVRKQRSDAGKPRRSTD